MDMVTVTAIAEHGNSYGERWQKKDGDQYGVPADVAASLARDGLVRLPEAKKARA